MNEVTRLDICKYEEEMQPSRMEDLKRRIKVPNLSGSRVMVLTLFSSTRDSLKAFVVSISDRLPGLRSRMITDSSSESSKQSESGTKYFLLENYFKELMEFRIKFWRRNASSQIPRTITCRKKSSFANWCNDFKISHVYVYKQEKTNYDQDSCLSTEDNDETLESTPIPNNCRDDYLSSLAFLADVADERSVSESCPRAVEHTENKDGYSSLLEAYFANSNAY